MEKLLSIAKQILDENPSASLTGTLMLKLRGIDLGREPHDIDILICDYAFNLVVPKDMIFEDLGMASYGCGQKYKCDDVIIDIISNGEEPELVDGFRLGTVEKLMQQKYLYSLQNNDQSKKHHTDLVKMGFVFPETESITLDELSF